ncbi:hypothetical protein [Vallitalea guaymasensis]|uniref:hypothetical protein n=1 Tax=Vallitalea guaymasensis TaxID=1185412 RepID=UPI000DE313EF|nr:hypothetical protein [Vallitalea guaymasensis]
MQNLIITNKGQELMAKLIVGTSTATFTKICTSDYDYTDTVIEDLLTLYQIKQETLVSKVTRTDTTIVEVLAAMNNTNLNEGYYIRGVGLYAKGSDDVEILYAVSITDTPDYMPPFSGSTVSGITFRLNTKVDNSTQVTLEVNPAAVPTIDQLQNVENELNIHIGNSVYSELGVHGFRYHNDTLQFDDGEGNWIDIETGGGGIAPNNVSDATIKVGNGKLTIKWSDPGDTVVDGQLLCTWEGTKLVQKAGSFPENIKDGTVILDNKVKDAYLSDGFEINGLTNGTTYYFQLFPYSDKNAVNENVANRLSAAPQPYKIMGLSIDLSNSNPATSITYTDDAVGMTPGDSSWDDFFGHYPCILLNGVEGVKLNPNDYTKDIDGNTVNLASATVGDVMVAFPRRGVKITTVGTTLTIKMTDDPDNADFEYIAHTRGITNKEKFYLGAYKGFVDSSKLRSWSGKTPTASQTIGTFRTQAQANGAGYDQSGFYQLIFRQVMYLLKYRNLDSQTAVGRGYVDGNSAAIATGGTNAKGMDFGEATGKLQMKLFGLEDFWGNVYEWIDGLVTNSTWNILTATDNFNDSGSGYTNQGQGATADVSGYMSVPQGTSETGFIVKTAGGSETTYFCDSAYLYDGCVACFGGNWSDASSAGAFRLPVYFAASYSSAYIAARLMYL